MKKWLKIKRRVLSREVVTVIHRSESSSPETLRLNARLAELATMPLPVVTR